MTMNRTLGASVALLPLLLATTAFAQDAASCSAYQTPSVEQLAATDLDAEFGPVKAPERELRFAYVTKTLINEFWQDVAQSAQAEAAKYNIKLDVYAPQDEASLSEQLNLAQTVLSQKPDAILLSPQSDSNLLPVIEAAKAQNIPTIIVQDSRTAGASVFLGPNELDSGKNAAEFLHKMFPDGGEVAQIEGQAGAPAARDRIKGFTDTLKNYPNLSLVASQPGDWDRLTAMNVATDLMRAHPDLKAIYANNDGMALGVYEAVRNAGKQDQVAVVGTDAIRQAIKSVEAGEMKATVALLPTTQGALGIQLALRVLDCQALPTWVVSPEVLIDADNVDQYVDAAPASN